MNYAKALLFAAISAIATVTSVSAAENRPTISKKKYVQIPAQRPNQQLITSPGRQANNSGEGLNRDRQGMEIQFMYDQVSQPRVVVEKGNRRVPGYRNLYNPNAALQPKQTPDQDQTQ